MRSGVQLTANAVEVGLCCLTLLCIEKICFLCQKLRSKIKFFKGKVIPETEKQTPKGIVFTYEGDETETPTSNVSIPKMKLFNEDEVGDELNKYFLDKKHIEVNKSPWTILEPRCVMSSQFSEDCCEKNFVEEKGHKFRRHKGKKGELERKIDSIEKVIGHKVEQREEKTKKTTQTLRYDSFKQQHKKHLIIDMSEKSVKTEVRKARNVGTRVSKESYYKVSKDLIEKFHGNGNEFSLLSSFGFVNGDIEISHNREKFEELKMSINPDKSHRHFCQPFLLKDNNVDIDVRPALPNREKFSTSEKLFAFNEDLRLSQGLMFFKMNSKQVESTDDYENIRTKLRFIINKKVARAKRKHIQRVKFSRTKKGKNK